MDQSYFEYHQIVARFLLGKTAGGEVATLPDAETQLLDTECADQQRQARMRRAFINVLREELLI